MVGERNGWKNTHTVFQNSLEPEWNAHQSLHYPTYECTGMGENGSSRSGDEPALPTGGSRPRTTRRCLITPWGRGGRGGRLEEVTQTGVHRHSLPFSKKKSSCSRMLSIKFAAQNASFQGSCKHGNLLHTFFSIHH